MAGNMAVCVLVVGTVLACKARPGSGLELAAGVLIIGGLSLIGAGLDRALY